MAILKAASQPCRAKAAFLGAVLLLAGCVEAPHVADSAAPCVPVGHWVRPAERRVVPAPDLFAELGGAGIVLAGEAHDRADHHRWQTQIAAGLLARRGGLAIGLEMLPRRAQAALDRWVAGETSEAEFLAESDWRRVWGFDFAVYRPIFELARLNRVPLVALNVERGLVSKVSERGWDMVPEAEREGVARPADASPGYLDRLAETFGRHRNLTADPVDRAAPEFRHFVEAQLLWDRAMAEALAAAHRRGAGVVLGIIGAGHVENGTGVTRQLAALGERSMALLPWDEDEGCGELVPGLADAVFGMAKPAPAPPPPRLGVAVEPVESGGLRITAVTGGSVGEAAGLRAGDILVEIAGAALTRPGDLIDAVRRQAPGTWLPIRLRRGGETIEAVAKFPR
jgi:uncharacterized iron-regulated protein